MKYNGSDGIFSILISQEEIQNEDREISTIQPFMSVLKVIQREKQTNERELNNQVGSLIGDNITQTIILIYFLKYIILS